MHILSKYRDPSDLLNDYDVWIPFLIDSKWQKKNAEPIFSAWIHKYLMWSCMSISLLLQKISIYLAIYLCLTGNCHPVTKGNLATNCTTRSHVTQTVYLVRPLTIKRLNTFENVSAEVAICRAIQLTHFLFPKIILIFCNLHRYNYT